MGGRCEPDHGAPTLATGGREFRGGCGGVGCGRACLRWRARARPTVVRVVMKAGFDGVEVGAGALRSSARARRMRSGVFIGVE